MIKTIRKFEEVEKLLENYDCTPIQEYDKLNKKLLIIHKNDFSILNICFITKDNGDSKFTSAVYRETNATKVA